MYRLMSTNYLDDLWILFLNWISEIWTNNYLIKYTFNLDFMIIYSYVLCAVLTLFLIVRGMYILNKNMTKITYAKPEIEINTARL